MSKVDWSLAPEGATHFVKAVGSHAWRDHSGIDARYWNGRVWDYVGLSSENCARVLGSMLVERPQPENKPWSGPEDGLPPVGTVCEVKGCMSHYLKWNKVTVFAVRGKTVMFDMEDGRWGQTESHEFRAIQTPEQLRETAIRELMDIAQVDCRVTAARLVDAGFKREAV